MSFRLRFTPASVRGRNIHLRRRCSRQCGSNLAVTLNPEPSRNNMADTEITPVIEQQRIGKPADPCAMVIFGASGDLTRRKLIPALYNLAKNKLLSRNFAVIGVARSPMTSEEYR